MIAADQSLARSNGRGVSASISLKNVEKVYGGPSGDLHAIAPLSIELPAVMRPSASSGRAAAGKAR